MTFGVRHHRRSARGLLAVAARMLALVLSLAVAAPSVGLAADFLIRRFIIFIRDSEMSHHMFADVILAHLKRWLHQSAATGDIGAVSRHEPGDLADGGRPS